MSEESGPGSSRATPWWVVWAALAFVVAGFAWLRFPWFWFSRTRPAVSEQTLEELALWGGAYGAFAAFFSGLGFIAVAIALYLQIRDSQKQREWLTAESEHRAKELRALRPLTDRPRFVGRLVEGDDERTLEERLAEAIEQRSDRLSFEVDLTNVGGTAFDVGGTSDQGEVSWSGDAFSVVKEGDLFRVALDILVASIDPDSGWTVKFNVSGRDAFEERFRQEVIVVGRADFIFAFPPRYDVSFDA